MNESQKAILKFLQENPGIITTQMQNPAMITWLIQSGENPLFVISLQNPVFVQSLLADENSPFVVALVESCEKNMQAGFQAGFQVGFQAAFQASMARTTSTSGPNTNTMSPQTTTLPHDGKEFGFTVTIGGRNLFFSTRENERNTPQSSVSPSNGLTSF